MADDHVQVDPDNVSGKRVDTESFTRSAETVYRQRVCLGGSADAEQVDILNSNPAGSEYGVAVRNIPSGTQPVSGTVAVTGTQTDALTDSELRATAVPVAPDTKTNATASGTLGALEATVVINAQGAGSIAVEIDAGLSGSIVYFEATTDDSNWFDVTFQAPINTQAVSNVSSFPFRGTLTSYGWSQVRARAGTYGSGSSAVRFGKSYGGSSALRRAYVDVISGVPPQASEGGIANAAGYEVFGTDGTFSRGLKTNASGELLVNPGSTHPPQALDGGAAAGAGFAAMGSDGSFNRYITTDASGNLQVDIVADDTGTMATAANQSTGNTSTDNIDTNTTDLPNVIGTDGAAGPTKAVSVAGTDGSGNLQELSTDTNGRLQVDVISGGGGGTQYTEADTAAANPTGTQPVMVSDSTPAQEVLEGEVVAQRATRYGAAYAQIVDSSGNLVDSFGGGTQYDEDTAHVTGDKVTMAGVVQQTADTALSGNGDRSLLQVDDSGFLKVNIKAGAGSGGTAMTDDAAFNPGTTSFTPAGGTYRSVRDSVDDNDAGAFAMTATRAMYAAIETPNGDSAMDDTNDSVKVTIASDSASLATASNQLPDGHAVTVDNTTGSPANVQIGDGTSQATVRNLAANDALNVAMVDGAGDHVTSFGGGTQYTEGDTDATIVGTALMMEDAADTLRAATGDVTNGLDVDVTRLPKDGQDTMANSIPVAIASNQSNVPTNTVQMGSTAVSMGTGTRDAGTQRVTVATDDSVPVTGTFWPGTQPVSGTVTANTTADATDGAAHGASQTGFRAMGTDGTNDQQIAVDATGNVQANIVTLPDEGQQTMANSISVAIASDQDILASQATLALVETNTDFGAVTGGGTETGAVRVTVANDSTGVLTVDQPTAANLNATVVQGTASNLNAEVQGDVAHDAAAAGNPVLMGASAETAADSAPANRVDTDGDAGRLSHNGDGAIYAIPSSPQQWDYHENSSNALTDQQVHAAPGANLSIYITDIVFSTGAATACNIFFEESTTTVLGPYYLEAVAGRGASIHFNTPKKITANTAVTVTTSAAIAHGLDVHGFIAPG
jgi:hypothetical protein